MRQTASFRIANLAHSLGVVAKTSRAMIRAFVDQAGGIDMSEYRVFCLDGSGQIHYAAPLHAASDEHAIKLAHDFNLRAAKCEIWDGDHLVATLDAEDLER